MHFLVAFSLAVLLLHAMAMAADEMIFHRRRGLPAWERWGHPLDTASVLLCYLSLVCFRDASALPWIFGGLAALSCACITKDEWVHEERCEATEQWLHSVLFVLHPVVLYCAWLLHAAGELRLLAVQAGLVAVFGAYQVAYWNFLRAPEPESNETAGTRSGPGSGASVASGRDDAA